MRLSRTFRRVAAICALMGTRSVTHAAPLPAPQSMFSIQPATGAVGASLSVPMQIVILLTLLTGCRLW